MDLFQQLQSQLMGNELGQGLSSGIMPSSSQPRGAPQVWIKAIAAARTEVDNLNKLADQLRRAGLDEEDRDVMAATLKMQGVLDKLKKRQLELQSGAM